MISSASSTEVIIPVSVVHVFIGEVAFIFPRKRQDSAPDLSSTSGVSHAHACEVVLAHVSVCGVIVRVRIGKGRGRSVTRLVGYCSRIRLVLSGETTEKYPLEQPTLELSSRQRLDLT